MISDDTISLLSKSLDLMKDEVKKRNIIYDYGVDLANYENHYSTVSINLISHLLGIKSDEVEWWLFESVEKVYFFKNKDNVNVENSYDFIMFWINHKKE